MPTPTPAIDLRANQLLEAMSERTRTQLATAGQPVWLKTDQPLHTPGAVIEQVYFPLGAVVATRAVLPDGRGVHTALVNSSGMVGVELALQMDMPMWASVVHVPGLAWRLDAQGFAQLISGSPACRQAVANFSQALLVRQLGQIACAHFHSLRPRLAAWLLAEHAMAKSGELQSTHLRLALAMGVRREAVTVVAVALAREGLIRYRRGHVSVLDRLRLGDVACACMRP